MATSMRGAGVVGYNVQAAVDAEHHLIVAHEVTNVVIDKTLLAPMAAKAKQAMGTETLEAFADRGYFSSDQLLECERIGVTPYVPKPRTSNARAAGRFDKEDFEYLPEQNAYRCPAGKTLTFRFTDVYEGRNVLIYFTNECGNCPLSPAARQAKSAACAGGSTSTSLMRRAIDSTRSPMP